MFHLRTVFSEYLRALRFHHTLYVVRATVRAWESLVKRPVCLWGVLASCKADYWSRAFSWGCSGLRVYRTIIANSLNPGVMSTGGPDDLFDSKFEGLYGNITKFVFKAKYWG